MAAKLLSDARIRGAKPAGRERLFADGDGLFLRLRPTGRDWLFIYGVGGKRRKMGLGVYPNVTLERARAKAQEARAIVADGKDPIVVRDEEELALRAAAAVAANRHTVRTLFELWHRKEASKVRSDGGDEIERAIKKDVLPSIGDLFADQIARRHVMEVLDAVKERGVTRYANLLLQYLRQMFRYAAMREIINGDPTFGIRKKDAGGAEGERTRVLAEDEIRELAGKLPAAGLTQCAEAAIWIMLSTCCRVGEISRARWSDVDFRSGHWRIPADHSKNGREHLIHLSPFAVRQFRKLESLKCSDVWMFPNPKDDLHVSTKSLQKQYHDRQRSEALRGRSKQTGALCLTGGEWTAHDLRRTGATLMGELGVRGDVIDKCLNHIGRDKIVKTYQRQELMGERARAFHVLGDRLALLVGGVRAKVVTASLRRGAKGAA